MGALHSIAWHSVAPQQHRYEPTAREARRDERRTRAHARATHRLLAHHLQQVGAWRGRACALAHLLTVATEERERESSLDYDWRCGEAVGRTEACRALSWPRDSAPPGRRLCLVCLSGWVSSVHRGRPTARCRWISFCYCAAPSRETMGGGEGLTWSGRGADRIVCSTRLLSPMPVLPPPLLYS